MCRLFYFFFESRGSKDDPVVIWLSGGPGCSSELALFYENGPFSISKNLSLVPNEYGWDKVFSLSSKVAFQFLQFLVSYSYILWCVKKKLVLKQ